MEEDKAELKFAAFPYKAYSIQRDFMKEMYQSLDRGGISMLQSPTGTGKTLSIICSALQWLIDRKNKLSSEAIDDSTQNLILENGCGSDDEPDWVRNFAVNKDSQVVEKEKIKNKKNKHRIKSIKPHKKSNQVNLGDLFSHRGEDEDICKQKSDKKSNDKVDAEKLDDDEFLVEEYESDDEREGAKRKSGGVSVSSSSEEEKEGNSSDDEDDDVAPLKIYFCSRTHSQLSQFIKELRKTLFASQLKVICLGSRKNFCNNEEVLKLGSSTRINERCLELQKRKKNVVSKTKILGAGGRIQRTKASSGCHMLKKYKLQKQFKSDIYEEGALDIEDIVHLGNKIGTCPYYGSRSVVPAADLVVLPYQSLLSKSSRESLGLDLKNNIVIIDEAHNLADSLISMYNSKITLSQLERVDSQLRRYFERFRTLLGPGNRRYIQTLMVFTRAFLKILQIEDSTEADPCYDAEGIPRAKGAKDRSMAINEFLFSLNIDNINLVKLLRYIKESNIIHKVSGYGDKVASLTNGSSLTNGDDTSDEGSKLSSFQALVDILLSLTHNDGDGRIIISRRPLCSGQEGGYIKYVMLTGEKIFSEIANQAHAVILAGGTLQPIEETRERLFPWLRPDQLHFFSCSHIVSSESILPIAVSQGPSGQSFDFSFSSRSSPSMIGELGLLLCNLVTVIPEGIVVFFSSFDYEGQVYDAWKASGILARIAKKKRIFREPRRNTDVDQVLKDYENTIDSSCNEGSKVDSTALSGAILLAVVGGKISEGINFSDGMGRCVIMVGLPYPSPSDIELIERIKHIDGLGDGVSNKPSDCNEFYGGDVRAGFDILRSCKRRGKEYYENLCMKAVNQSIGRAIRHVNDYAAILLVDARYATDPANRSFNHPTTKLPEWIKASFVSKTQNYGEVHRLLHKFFKLNKTKVAP